jgi:hypothetical protein
MDPLTKSDRFTQARWDKLIPAPPRYRSEVINVNSKGETVRTLRTDYKSTGPNRHGWGGRLKESS